MMFKSLIWYRNAVGTLRSSGDLLDPAYEAMGSLDAAHKALHRATPFVRSQAISVEVTICTPNNGYPVRSSRDPWDYGSTKQYTVDQLVGVPA
ncbi:hypothetical protein Lo5R7ANS_06 [Mesorhizobium phage vB_MloP_Lo5R7ANS]|uniref:Uncharacterized protein n=1 Tax=Mesorhizobium phage vB_MloP_Lo5R7ANS TaxID=1527771 RepID=A0A076YQH3_9CAUD|nr:hypothetical protein Lo5R7ANS_06 [Mesorhizobium phage vB_MloP_Lo5R7ANS]AIK68476.1 hypothetical protein Lo5R7ANS_06 [Mesorhizobium phage vB_MloP_Lo5R7ANS]